MDSKFFRLPTKPNFYAGLETAPPVDIRNIAERSEFPAPDSRFPGWAAPMSDARLVTDYRPHCAKNIPVGRQFPTKAWMQQNAVDIMNYSRKTYSERLGADLPYDDSVVPPPALVVTCTKGGCERKETEAAGGIGMERADGAISFELFGTYEPASRGRRAVVTRTPLTARQEGGRNSVRGTA